MGVLVTRSVSNRVFVFLVKTFKNLTSKNLYCLLCCSVIRDKWRPLGFQEGHAGCYYGGFSVAGFVQILSYILSVVDGLNQTY